MKGSSRIEKNRYDRVVQFARSDQSSPQIEKLIGSIQ
jgi:hypothetical protein